MTLSSNGSEEGSQATWVKWNELAVDINIYIHTCLERDDGREKGKGNRWR